MAVDFGGGMRPANLTATCQNVLNISGESSPKESLREKSSISGRIWASREPVNLQGPRFASIQPSVLSVSSLGKTAEMVADLGWVFLMALQWS